MAEDYASDFKGNYEGIYENQAPQGEISSQIHGESFTVCVSSAISVFNVKLTYYLLLLVALIKC